MRFNRRLSPFMFSGLLPLLCSTQGLPGDGGGGGGTAGGAPPAANGAPPAGGAAPPPPTGDGAGGNAGQFKPEWLNERIGQAKNSARAELLKELGVADAAGAAKLLEEGKKALDAQKTEIQRKDERIKELEVTSKDAATAREVLGKRASAELALLPEAAQTRIKALAGEDPIKLLEAIDLAKAMAPAPPAAGAAPNGAAPPAQGAPAPGTKPPAIPPAANTSTAAGGPPSAQGSPPDHLAVWKGYIDAGNPMAAAQYYDRFHLEISAARQQKTT